MNSSTQVKGIIFGLLAAAIWGGMYVVSDVVLQVIPPFTLLTMRLVLGILVLGGMAYFQREKIQNLTSRQVFQLIGIGILGFGISVGAQFVGTDESTAINGSLVTSASPAFILIFAALLLHEKLTPQRIAAVILATVGVIIIIDPSKADFGSETFRGNIALAIAAVTWGLYSILIRRVSATIDTLLVTLIAFCGGLLLTVPAAVVELQSRSLGQIDGGIILGVLYLGVVSTAGAMWLWNRAFALIDGSIASLTFFAQPLVGAVLSVILLHQEVQPSLLVGGILIAMGVLLSVYPVEKFAFRRPTTELPVK
ncbi:MAG: DMT family transporter [Chloroflexi bacterium]|nr:DMT family transporter [Chloroflexota bacterium]MCC6892175.1 DMT family transporter [Anaerolineae bacterium]